MDISQAFLAFLATLKESLQLLLKNWRFVGSIFVISQLLTFMLYLLFVRSLLFVAYEILQRLDDSFSYLQMLLCFLLLFAVQMSFLLIFNAVSHLSCVATLLVFSKSYTHEILSLEVFLSGIKTIYRRLIFNKSTRYLFFGIIPTTLLVYIVNDDDMRVKHALEKAEKLTPNRRLQGVMLSLFSHLSYVIILLGYWAIWGQEVSVSQMILYGLFIINFINMAVFAAYTVFYFQCQEDKGATLENRVDEELLVSVNMV